MEKNLQKFHRPFINNVDEQFREFFLFCRYNIRKTVYFNCIIGLTVPPSKTFHALLAADYLWIYDFFRLDSELLRIFLVFSPITFSLWWTKRIFSIHYILERIKIRLVIKPINAIKWRNFIQFLFLFPVAAKIFQAGQMNFCDKKMWFHSTFLPIRWKFVYRLQLALWHLLVGFYKTTKLSRFFGVAYVNTMESLCS